MVNMTYIGEQIKGLVSKESLTSRKVLDIIEIVKNFDENTLYQGENIPDIVIKAGLVQKQVNRQEAVELMLKMI